MHTCQRHVAVRRLMALSLRIFHIKHCSSRKYDTDVNAHLKCAVGNTALGEEWLFPVTMAHALFALTRLLGHIVSPRAYRNFFIRLIIDMTLITSSK